MRKILVTSAGGAAAINFVRSLKLAPERFFYIGVDCNKYHLARAETDLKFLMPVAEEADYIGCLKDIVRQTYPDLIHAQSDPEIFFVSKYRVELNGKLFLPSHSTIEVCQNKFKSYEKWKEKNLKVPLTMRLSSSRDLRIAFKEIGRPLWIRNIISPGAGKQSLIAPNFRIAKEWIELYNGWGRFSASRYLSPYSVTWMSIWYNGQLIVGQGRKRLYWEFSNRAPSGVTGVTGAGITICDQEVSRIAQEAILAIDEAPNGIFSVDMTYDNETIPNPTEINIGRFFTTNLFFARAGLNMPYIYIKLGLGEEPPRPPKKIDPLSPNLVWVRGMDCEPILTTVEAIEEHQAQFLEMRKRVNV